MQIECAPPISCWIGKCHQTIPVELRIDLSDQHIGMECCTSSWSPSHTKALISVVLRFNVVVVIPFFSHHLSVFLILRPIASATFSIPFIAYPATPPFASSPENDRSCPTECWRNCKFYIRLFFDLVTIPIPQLEHLDRHWLTLRIFHLSWPFGLCYHNSMPFRAIPSLGLRI